jgi:single-stranded-DNA-specific exonuclease
MPKYVVRERVGETLTEHLLYHRGITSVEEQTKFLNPDYEAHTHDPFLMKDMEKVVARIVSAVEKNERTAIFSDYDADGIPGAVVMHDFFKKVGYTNFENYIPDRHVEGFGLNTKAVEDIAARGARLLLTIDCGITDREEVARANVLGMEVIITDHHLPGIELPPAYAILNPKQDDCAYPEKMLCGSGVVFKLVQALCSRLKTGNIPHGWEKWLLDMIGLATLSDMVPLTGENRTFAHYGLKVLRKSPRVGLAALFRELRVEREHITEDDVGFVITPRINAASRMGQPFDAFRLFSTSDALEAGMLATHLNKINDERKGRVAALVREVRRIVAEGHASRAPAIVVAGNPAWRPALLGLVANTLVEDYRKPVFVWGREGNNILKGSCRSDGSVDLSALMHEARSVFSDFGGHREAGGFAVALEKVHLLENELERAYERVRQEREKEEPKYRVDAALSLDEVGEELWRSVARLAPFGVGNPKPLFLFECLRVSLVELFGRERQHLKLIFQKKNGERVSAVKFYSTPDDFDGLAAGQQVNILAHLEQSFFRSVPELRLRLVDIV